MSNTSRKKKRYRQSAFLFNPKDFLSDTADFTNQELGIYMRLLSTQWINKTIPNDLSRLYNIAGTGDPKYKSEMVRNVQRDVQRDDVRQDNVTESLRSPQFASFEECWGHIKEKFTLTEDGQLVNLRLEEERQASSEYFENQKERTKAATEARVAQRGKDGQNEVRNVQRNDDRNVQRNVQRNDDRNVDLKNNVTLTNSNTNSNTVTNNKIKGTDDFPDPIKTQDLQDHGFTPREFSLQRAGDTPLRLFITGCSPEYGATVESALNAHRDKFLMTGDLWKKEYKYQVFLLESFFNEQALVSPDISVGKLVRNFVYFFSSQKDRMEREFNQSQRTEKWFDEEVQKANGICKDDVVRNDFIKYYKNRQPSGSLYFETIRNFDVKEALTRWVQKEHKTFKKLEKISGNVMPKEGMTIEQLQDHYKQE
jgi:uncharacterized protein YdaU (DUF1376 family)